MFAHRTEWSLHLNRLTRLLEEKKEAGVPILDLTESNPTRCKLQDAQRIRQALTQLDVSTYHPSPRGLLQTRKAIARYYSEKGSLVHPEQIFLTASTSEAYSFVFRLLLNPHEALLAPKPSYPLLDYLAALHDVELLRYPLRYDSRWTLDQMAFRKTATSKTRAILLVHPNNPTGSFVTQDEQRCLTHFAQENHLALICDEVFLDYVFPDVEEVPVSFAEASQGLHFTLSGISKVLGLPQMKLSWVVVSGTPSLCEEAAARLEVIADTYLSVSTPSQLALGEWFSMRDVFQKNIQTRLLQNHTTLKALCKSTPKVQPLRVEGGWSLILKLQDENEEALVLRLLRDFDLLVHPGYFFDLEDASYLVLSLLVPPQEFEEGLQRLFRALS